MPAMYQQAMSNNRTLNGIKSPFKDEGEDMYVLINPSVTLFFDGLNLCDYRDHNP